MTWIEIIIRSVILYVILFTQVGGFLQVLWFPPPIETDCHYITEILFKKALNTIILTP
jgi:hypothetical protein